MPIDPNLSLQVRVPQIEGPLEMYTKALTLRGMMDDRRYNQARLEKMRFEQRKEEEEYVRDAQFRQALGDPNVNLSTLSAIDPAKAYKLFTDRRQLETAEATGQKTALELYAKQQDEVLNNMAAVMTIKDPAARAAEYKRRSYDLWNRKVISLANRDTPMPDEATFEAKYNEVKGPDAWATRKAAEATAERARLAGEEAQTEAGRKGYKHQMEVAEQVLGGVQSQADWDKFLPLLPPEIRAQMGPMFSPTAMYRAKGFFLTEQQKGQLQHQTDQEKRQLWTTPGGLTSIITGKEYTPEQKKQATEQLNLLAGYHSVANPPAGPMDPARVAQDIAKAVEISRRTGEAAAGREPATEAENRSLGFYDRSAEADKTLESVKDHIKDKSTVGLWWIQSGPNRSLSKEDQAYLQGARQFINAYLRRDSGAAIQPSEWDEAYKTFLPYPGDKPETLALKARERKVIIEGLKTSAGRAYTRKYGEPDATPPKGSAAPPPNARPGGKKAPAVGTVEDGYQFQGGDPSKPENWKKVQ